MSLLLVKEVLEHKYKHLLRKPSNKYHNTNKFKFLHTINNHTKAVERPGQNQFEILNISKNGNSPKDWGYEYHKENKQLYTSVVTNLIHEITLLMKIHYVNYCNF